MPIIAKCEKCDREGRYGRDADQQICAVCEQPPENADPENGQDT